MSEYTPITGELRERIEQAEHIVPLSGDSKDAQVRINLAWLKEKLDAIDSIHAQLERENEDLRMKFVNANRHAQHVERENESLKAELDRVLYEQERDGWVELPKDADGEYIHIGDRMENNERVSRIVLTDDDWQPSVYLEKIPNVLHEYFCNEISHYHPDTWELIIEDARTCTGSAGNYTSVPSMRWTNEVDALVARCKALCERTKEDV